MDSAPNHRREIWLKVSPDLNVSLLAVTVDGHKVAMSQQAVAAVVGDKTKGLSDDPYYVSYPVVVELLGNNNYRLWGEI